MEQKGYNKCRKGFVIASLLFFVFILAGCRKNDTEKVKTLRVGVVIYTSEDPFINSLITCQKEAYEELEGDNLRIIMSVRSGGDDQNTQNEVVEEMIDAGCDILCVNLVDRTEPAQIIHMAKENDIPIIFFNREPVREDLMQWDKMYYIGCDAAESGIMQGEMAADDIKANSNADKNNDGKIQYVILEGEAGHQDAIIRTDKSVQTLLENGIELEKVKYQFADWNRQQAENKVKQLIDQYNNSIELILSNNDEMAMGAIAAYENSSLSMDEWPLIYGIDGLPDALNAVKDGSLQGTVYNDCDKQARTMANLSLDLFMGNSLDNYSFVDGRYILCSYEKVDKINVDEYINK